MTTKKTAKGRAARKASVAKRAVMPVSVVASKVRKPRSHLLASVHESVAGLHGEGLVDKATIRRFDAMCLVPVPDFAPEEIARIRIAQAVSQAVFAKYLNTSTDTISKWEQGVKRPTALGRKLLDLVRRKGLRALA